MKTNFTEKYIIIPDIHGRFNQFIQAISQFITIDDNLVITNTNGFKLIQLGDFIDKAPSIVEQIKIIDFIHLNINAFHSIIIGNHEAKTLRYLKDNTIKMSPYYDTYKIFNTNHYLQSKFIDICQKSTTYYEDKNIFCTHSPCLNKHKILKSTEMTQFPFSYSSKFDSKKDFDSYISHFFNQFILDSNSKISFHGHLEMQNILKVNNAFWLDTGKNGLNLAVIDNQNISFYQNNIIIDYTSIFTSKQLIDSFLYELL